MSAESAQFFARLATQPAAARQAIYERCIDGLVNAGVWAKLDFCYLLAAADEPAAKVNLVSSSFTLTEVGVNTFAADGGYTGQNGNTGVYLETSFAPASGTPHYARNSASMFAWRNTNPANDDGSLMGIDSSQSSIEPYRPDGKFYYAINNISGGFQSSLADYTGLFGCVRDDANLIRPYVRGAPAATTVNASAAITAAKTARILHNGAANGSICQVSAALMGSAMAGPDVRNINAFIGNYIEDLAGGTRPPQLLQSSDIVNDGANNFTPGIARLADGRVFACYCVGHTDPQFNGKIVYHTSSDDGLTWSAAADVSVPAAGFAYSDTSVTVLASGKIMISTMYAQNADNPWPAHVIIGTVAGDLSISWGARINVSTGKWTTSAPLELADGRIMLGLYILGTGVTVKFSSDQGATWGGEVVVAAGDVNNYFNESNYVQLANGNIVGILRNDATAAENTAYWRTVSTDSGATWSAPAIVITNTVSEAPGRPAITLCPSGRIFGIFRCTDGSQNGATGWTWSDDAGVTWATMKLYYSIGLLASYGTNVYNQSFWDDATGTVMSANGFGDFDAGQMTFQQFYVEEVEEVPVVTVPPIVSTPDDPGRKGPKKKRQKRPLDIQGTTEGMWAGRPAYRVPVDRRPSARQETLSIPQPKVAPAAISEKTLLEMSLRLAGQDEDEQDMEILRRMGAFD